MLLASTVQNYPLPPLPKFPRYTGYNTCIQLSGLLAKFVDIVKNDQPIPILISIEVISVVLTALASKQCHQTQKAVHVVS